MSARTIARMFTFGSLLAVGAGAGLFAWGFGASGIGTGLLVAGGLLWFDVTRRA